MVDVELIRQIELRVRALAKAGISVASLSIDGFTLNDESRRDEAHAILDAFDPVVAQSEVEAEEAAERDRQAWLKIAKNYVDDGIQDAKDVAKTYADSTFATQANAQDKENLIATLSAKIAELDAKIALVDTLAKAVDAKVELLKVAAPK